MKKRKLLSWMALGSALALVSCGGSSGGGTRNFTSKTGWKPNENRGWFYTGKDSKQKGWPGMVYIEGGTFTMGAVKDDVMKDWNNTPHRMQVSSFYLGETEITNYEYREYLTWLKYVFPPSDPQYREIYNGALPDTLLWENKLGRNDFSTTYFRSPQFDFYPVVGVSWSQAERYCEWLTDRANEKALMDKGVISKDLYINEANNVGGTAFNMDKFQSNDPDIQAYINEKRAEQQLGMKNANARIVAANKSPGPMPVNAFRLPTEAEWEFAALGLAKDRNYNNYKEKDPRFNRLKASRGGNQGMYLQNFKVGKGDYSGTAGWKNDGSAYTSDVKQYPANDIGLFGMYGNVSEWTADVYRPVIESDYNDFNYFRGSAPSRIVRNEDGSMRKVADGEVRYDTLADGRLLYKNLPGHYQRETIADYSNFRDGDRQSSLNYRAGSGSDSANLAYNMYNGPRREFIVDASGRVIMQPDANKRSSDITNRVRVVKGGSWKDTAYWLDPGQRRYKPQGNGYAWIGFRVAQDGRETGKRTRR